MSKQRLTEIKLNAAFAALGLAKGYAEKHLLKTLATEAQRSTRSRPMLERFDRNRVVLRSAQLFGIERGTSKPVVV
jgi:hypothetical protein